jgi:hypothetical protein
MSDYPASDVGIKPQDNFTFDASLDALLVREQDQPRCARPNGCERACFGDM